MTAQRVTAYIDGFNLYHAIHELTTPKRSFSHLKWLNLWELARSFAPEPDFSLTDVYYFSAYATWRPDAYKRHRAYVRALTAIGVTPILGNFKRKDRECFRCANKWRAPEEKETDVNIALHLLRGAYQDRFDRALLISADSDLAPAIRMVREETPLKDIRVVLPIGLSLSGELSRAAAGKKRCARVKQVHLERSLLPQQVRDDKGSIVATRPTEYDPPA
jgi:uncharacterized LabA/DUF88 family protein